VTRCQSEAADCLAAEAETLAGHSTMLASLSMSQAIAELHGLSGKRERRNQFPQAIADLLAGVNTYQFITLLPVVQLINTGKLRALAVMGHKRNPALPDVPTIAEAGFPKLTAEDWAGLLVKAGTPLHIIERLNRAVNEALKTDKVRDALAKIGTDVNGGTPEEFGAHVHAETVRWTKVIKDAGIKINT
jgi:tripartite-type tricarboxylate transporter receptor subunit TctC